jgi:hypothetical protein
MGKLANRQLCQAGQQICMRPLWPSPANAAEAIDGNLDLLLSAHLDGSSLQDSKGSSSRCQCSALQDRMCPAAPGRSATLSHYAATHHCRAMLAQLLLQVLAIAYGVVSCANAAA